MSDNRDYEINHFQEPGILTSDLQLISQIITGDKSRYDELVLRYQKDIYYYLRRMGLEHDDAADVMQNSFIMAYRKLDTLKDKSKFKSWLFMIAGNTAKNHFRKNDKRNENPLEEGKEVSGGSNPDRDIQQVELNERMRRAVARLPQSQRRVVTLRAFQQMRFKEIAEVCEMSVSAAKVNYHRALKSLAKILRPVYEDLSSS